jgi:hypothetical protein
MVNLLKWKMPTSERIPDLRVCVCDIFGEQVAWCDLEPGGDSYCSLYNHLGELVGSMQDLEYRRVYSGVGAYIGQMLESGLVVDEDCCKVGYVSAYINAADPRGLWYLDAYRFLGEGDSAYMIARVKKPILRAEVNVSPMEFASAAGALSILRYLKLAL